MRSSFPPFHPQETYIHRWSCFLQKSSCQEVSCYAWDSPLSSYLFPLVNQELRKTFCWPKDLKVCGTRSLINHKDVWLAQPYYDRLKLASNSWWSTLCLIDFFFPPGRERLFFFQLFYLGILFSQHSTHQNKHVPHRNPVFSEWVHRFSNFSQSQGAFT